jgi:predicted nucleic-acid-binding Zn-ribbon protein
MKNLHQIQRKTAYPIYCKNCGVIAYITFYDDVDIYRYKYILDHPLYLGGDHTFRVYMNEV